MLQKGLISNIINPNDLLNIVSENNNLKIKPLIVSGKISKELTP